MTYQRPAYEEVRIAHGGSTVALRPTLRAAATLEARHGFPALFRALDEGSFTIISEIILTTALRQDAAAFLFLVHGRPLSSFFTAVTAPLAELVIMLRPASDPKAKAATNVGPVTPWSDYYADQFEKATGWLGWTPEATWNATPTEIDRAYSSHIAKLKAIHGSGEDAEADKPTDPEQAAQNEAAGLDPEFDRAGLRALKAKIGGGV